MRISDDAPLEERARARSAARLLRRDLSAGVGALDPAAIAQVAAEAWPVVADTDELHDALLALDRAAAVRGMAGFVCRA